MKVNDQAQASGSKRPCPVGADTAAPGAKKPAAAVQGVQHGEVIGAGSLGGTAGHMAGDVNGGSGGVAGLEGDGESRVVATAAPDPNLQILEVTNDGTAINMEMLIHLKV